MKNTERTDASPAFAARVFDLSGLDGISDAQIGEHLELYGGYVKQVNSLTQALAEMRSRGEAWAGNPAFAEITRRVGFEYDGMVLHEYYFENLRSEAEPRPPLTSDLAAALTRWFGSIEQWQAGFEAIGGVRGVGWVILFEDPATGRLVNHWITLHQDGIPVGLRPLLVMDVWEHAFMRDYRASERQHYVHAFCRNVDWTVVEDRLGQVGRARRNGSAESTPGPASAQPARAARKRVLR